MSTRLYLVAALPLRRCKPPTPANDPLSHGLSLPADHLYRSARFAPRTRSVRAFQSIEEVLEFTTDCELSTSECEVYDYTDGAWTINDLQTEHVADMIY